MRSRFKHGGFTIAELVALLLVTAIVVTIAVSAYTTYSVRRQVSAALDAAKFLQPSIERAFRLTGETPARPTSLGQPSMPNDSLRKYVEAVDVSNGRIDLLFGNEAHPALAGRQLSLTPYESALRKITWLCGNRIPPKGVRPLGFTTGGRMPVQIATTVEARHLPSSCR